jgi:glutamate formiminotransferase
VSLRAIPNISEGRDTALVSRIAGTDALLDIHSDPDHNRSVLTYEGDDLTTAVAAMIERAVATLDIRTHSGAHPRFGVVDVLPFVGDGADHAADEITWTIAQTVGVPVYRYGSDRTLPELRRWLRTNEHETHPSAGVICIGVRGPLVAFNVNIDATLDEARRIAKAIRGPNVRALAFDLPSRGLVQVSMNLVAPYELGPKEAFAMIDANVVDCEIVGLVPDGISTDGLPFRASAISESP